MNTKWSNFRIVILSCLFAFAHQSIAADEIEQSIYNRRVDSYKDKWASLVPSYIKLQYAGSMGFLSLGTGWDYGKHRQWETDIYFGFLPKYESSRNKMTFTIKQNYIPWDFSLSDKFSIEPLTCGLYLTSVFDEDFWPKQPKKYPNGYYWFSLRVRTNFCVGQRFVFNIPEDRRKRSRALSLFYEVSTNDFYLISAFDDSYLKLHQIFHLSLGAKMQLF